MGKAFIFKKKSPIIVWKIQLLVWCICLLSIIYLPVISLFLIGWYIKKSSPLKLLGQINKYLVWGIYGKTFTKFSQLVPIRQKYMSAIDDFCFWFADLIKVLLFIPHKSMIFCYVPVFLEFETTISHMLFHVLRQAQFNFAKYIVPQIPQKPYT